MELIEYLQGNDELGPELRRELVQRTVTQLNKDLLLVGEEIDFKDEAPSPYEELRKKLKKLLIRVEEKDRSSLRGLLYRVDVDQEVLQNMLKQADGREYWEVLADLILEREVTKVFYKMKYSKKGSSGTSF